MGHLVWEGGGKESPDQKPPDRDVAVQNISDLPPQTRYGRAISERTSEERWPVPPPPR